MGPDPRCEQFGKISHLIVAFLIVFRLNGLVLRVACGAVSHAILGLSHSKLA